MTHAPGPIQLERRTYRRRRMADAARLLPLLGAVLVCLPLLWARDGEGAAAETAATTTTYAMFYLFAVWLGLVVVSGLISRHLRSEDERGTRRGD